MLVKRLLALELSVLSFLRVRLRDLAQDPRSPRGVERVVALGAVGLPLFPEPLRTRRFSLEVVFKRPDDLPMDSPPKTHRLGRFTGQDQPGLRDEPGALRQAPGALHLSPDHGNDRRLHVQSVHVGERSVSIEKNGRLR